MRSVSKLGTGLLLAAILLGFEAAQAAPPDKIELPGDRVFPESVTSTLDGTLYVGSIPGGGVMKVSPGQAKAEPWIAPGAFGTRSTFGVLADEKAGILWMCSNDVSAMGVPGPSTVEGAYLKGFDLKTGQGKISAKFPGPNTFCNDMAVARDGTVYVTNSRAPQILRLEPGSDKLEVFVENSQFDPPAKSGAGLDGIAIGQDGNLYVDKFTEAALFRVDVKDGKAGPVTKLKTSQPLVLADALRPLLHGEGFLMIEGRGRLDRVTVSGGSASIETLKDGLDGPTGVAQAGNVAWVSEGQLPHLFGDKAKPNLPFVLRAVPVPTP